MFGRTTLQISGVLCLVVTASRVILWAGDGPALESTLVCMAWDGAETAMSCWLIPRCGGR